jgi:hypothetical protein
MMFLPHVDSVTEIGDLVSSSARQPPATEAHAPIPGTRIDVSKEDSLRLRRATVGKTVRRV